MDIRDFLRTIGRQKVAFFVILTVFVLTGIAAVFLLPTRYEASATIIGVPPKGAADFNSVEAVQFSLPTIVQDVSTVTFRNLVRQALPPGVAPQGLSIQATLEQGTGILHLRARDRDKSVVVPVANTAARVLVNQKVTPSVELKILDPAHSAGSASAKVRAPLLVSSIALGLIFAVFAALFRDAFNRRLRSTEEIYERLGLEILGEIPALKKFPATPASLLSTPGHARVAEAYQRLVTNLEVTLTSQNIRSIAITSAASGEGKTTVTTSLAWMLALLGHDVVAIDADLRKPTLHRRLEVDSATGLATASNGNVASLERRTALRSLSVIPAGQGARHPAQVVNSEFPAILAGVEDRLALIDTPPVLAAAEAMLVAMMAKHVILVIDRKSAASEDVERVLHELRRAKAEVLGVVVNRAKIRRSAAGYDDYYVPVQTAEPLRTPRPRQTSASRIRTRRRTSG
jgi:succinoglycan biosynthesis transport protein ExoP